MEPQRRAALRREKKPNSKLDFSMLLKKKKLHTLEMSVSQEEKKKK